jgi:hypothetical protein
MRDALKTEDYFIKKYSSQNARIKKFESTLRSLDNSNECGINIGKLHLANLFLHSLKLSYSMGKPLNDMYNYYLEFLKYYKDVCTPNDSLYDMIDILSMGVLFQKKKNEFWDILCEIVIKFGSEDGLIIFLTNYLEEKPIQYTNSQIDYFNRLIESDYKSEILALELDSWYKEHKDAYWYNTHESSRDTYYGYWCFEVAALVKVLRINDSEFRTHKFYPVDLAEYPR